MSGRGGIQGRDTVLYFNSKCVHRGVGGGGAASGRPDGRGAGPTLLPCLIRIPLLFHRILVTLSAPPPLWQLGHPGCPSVPHSCPLLLHPHRDDLVEALLTSCHIPIYANGSWATLYRGRYYVDGGVTDFVPSPPTPTVVKVCCFPVSEAFARVKPSVKVCEDLNLNWGEGEGTVPTLISNVKRCV